jgi:hypothetical protein
MKETIPPPLPNPIPPLFILSRILGLSGSITLKLDPNKMLGVALFDPFTLSPLLKSFGGKSSIFFTFRFLGHKKIVSRFLG